MNTTATRSHPASLTTRRPEILPVAVFLMLGGFLFFSCRSETAPEVLSLSRHHQVVFLDSLLAGKAILDDDKEGFFDRVSVLDMSLQMGRNYSGDTPREQVLADYRAFLQSDVADFKPSEIAYLTGILREAYALCEKRAPRVFPAELLLIKSHGKQYGPAVFYTREDRIIIPAGELEKGLREHFLRLMLHEIFHVYSRYHPEERDALYQLIGFGKLPVSVDQLDMNDTLRQRILLNPDGMDITYAVTFAPPEGDTIQAIPIFHANDTRFTPDRPFFFDYSAFYLYQVELLDDGRYKVLSTPTGQTTLSVSHLLGFYDRITPNTDYIIHPDEIMADNFSFLLLSRAGTLTYRPERFTPEGQTLLNHLEALLR